jgi:hypothetical protein
MDLNEFKKAVDYSKMENALVKNIRNIMKKSDKLTVEDAVVMLGKKIKRYKKRYFIRYYSEKSYKYMKRKLYSKRLKYRLKHNTFFKIDEKYFKYALKAYKWCSDKVENALYYVFGKELTHEELVNNRIKELMYHDTDISYTKYERVVPIFTKMKIERAKRKEIKKYLPTVTRWRAYFKRMENYINNNTLEFKLSRGVEYDTIDNKGIDEGYWYSRDN